MANDMFNNARGRARQEFDLGSSDAIAILLKNAEADDTLQDYDDLSALLAAAGNDEADFTNYSRKVIANANVTVTVDNSGNVLDIGIPDLTYTDAGGTTDNSVVKLLVCVDGADDSSRLPVTHHDVTFTTDGSTVTLSFSNSRFYRSS